MDPSGFAQFSGGLNDFSNSLATLFGTSGSESTKSSGTQSVDAASQSILNALLEATRNETSTQDSTGTQTQTSEGSELQNVAALDEGSLENLRGIIADLTARSNGTAESNIDIEGARNSAVDRVIEQGIAQVIGQNAAAGTFQNTSVADAAERLGEEAARAGADTEAQLQLQDQDQVLSALQGLLGVEKGATVASTTDTSGSDTIDTQASTNTNTSETQTQQQTQEQTTESSQDTEFESKSKTKSSGGGVLSGLF